MITNKLSQMPVENLRISPHSIEAEQSVLGALMIVQHNDKLIRDVADLLRPEMFYDRQHQVIYKAIQDCKNGTDIMLVEDQLKKSNDLEESGGFVYLGSLCQNTPGVSNTLEYCEIVRQRYHKRQLLGYLYSAEEQIYNQNNTDYVLECLNRNIEGIDTGGAYEAENLRDSMAGWVETLQKRADGDVDYVGVKTGIRDIDNQIGGIKRNWLVSLVGRPSHGKTMVCQMINANVSKQLPTLFFSMEMAEEEIIDRYVGILAGLDPNNIRDGLLNEFESARVEYMYKQMEQQTRNILFDTDPELSYQQISNRIKKTIKKHGKLGLVTIDYLGIMKHPNAERHDLKIAEITRNLKRIIKETSTPILLLVQANREADKLDRATNSNIADGSAVEKDSDLVMFCHSEEVKDPETAYKGVFQIYGTKGRHSKLNHPVYLRQSECGHDLHSGQFECLGVEELAILDHEEKIRLEKKNEGDKPKRDGKIQDKYKGSKL